MRGPACLLCCLPAYISRRRPHRLSTLSLACALVELSSQRLNLTQTSLQFDKGRVHPEPFCAAKRSQELQQLVLHPGADVGLEPERGICSNGGVRREHRQRRGQAPPQRRQRGPSTSLGAGGQ